VADVISLMERDPATWPYKRSRFGNNLFRLRHVDQHKARRRKIEGRPGQPGVPGVSFEHFDVSEAAL